MRFHSSLLMVAMLSASLFYAENLTPAKVEKAQSNTARAVEADARDDKLSAYGCHRRRA